jgi:hypothetical protein
VAAARLGAKTQFVGMLGRDMFGDFLADSLVEHGVGTDYIVRTDAAKTALAFVALDANGERSFSFYRPPAADLLFRDSDFQAACLDSAQCFHVCSNSLTEPAIAEATFAGMDRARAAGAVVSLDLNLRPALWPATKIRRRAVAGAGTRRPGQAVARGAGLPGRAAGRRWRGGGAAAPAGRAGALGDRHRWCSHAALVHPRQPRHGHQLPRGHGRHHGGR